VATATPRNAATSDVVHHSAPGSAMPATCAIIHQSDGPPDQEERQRHTSDWYAGNPGEDSGQYRGWLLGNFVPDGPRHSDDVEIKWGVHPAGQKRDDWVTDERRTTLVLLVSGRFQVELSTGTVLLQNLGDHLVWGPGVDHTWQADVDSVVVTVRWPSFSSSQRLNAAVSPEGER
jgi:hypothetical protein